MCKEGCCSSWLSGGCVANLYQHPRLNSFPTLLCNLHQLFKNIFLHLVATISQLKIKILLSKTVA